MHTAIVRLRGAQRLALVVGLLGLSGCSMLDFSGMRADAARQARDLVAESSSQGKGLTEVERIDEAAGPLLEEINEADLGDVSMEGSGRIGDLLRVAATKNHYSVVFAEGVHQERHVAVAVHKVSAADALRRIAAAAGYVAILDEAGRTATIAEQGVYIFKLPAHVLQSMDTSYTVGGNPVSGGGASGSGSYSAPGMGGGAAPSGQAASSIKAEFTTSGKVGTNLAALTAYLSQVAGTNAVVSVSQDLGMVTVRSNGVALARVRDFFNRLAQSALRRIEIKGSVVEVSLTGEFSYGIDWTRVLRGGTFTIAATGAPSVANPGLTLSLARTSVSSIINALRQHTQIRVLTQPTVSAMNRTAAVLFDGVQQPYLGSLSTTQTNVGVTTAGTGAYAVDGVSLSIFPDIFSDREAQLTVLPVLANVGDFHTFPLGGGGQITMPVQASKQSLMHVIVESGKTVILGGIRYSKGTEDQGGAIPFLNTRAAESQTHREIVVLLQANIVPGRRYESLFAESL